MTEPVTEYVHGRTDPREVERLDRQAAFVAPWSLEGFDAAPGHRVLDLGCGTGAMAAELARRFPGIDLVGLDRSSSQLAVARVRHPIARYVEGDAAAMPFEDGAFDRVHASWLLEHVEDPVAVLREVRRVLSPGGIVQIVEVDNETFGTDPELPVAVEVLRALDRAQLAAGGDPYVGRKLSAHFAAAGFDDVEVRPAPLLGDAHDPARFRAFAEEFAEIFESADEALGPSMQARIAEAAAAIRALPDRPGASMRYRASIARAVR